MTDAVAEQLFKGTGTALVIRGMAAVLFGIYAIVDGGTNIVHYVSGKKRRSVWQLVGGIISLLAGVVTYIWPGITALSLALVIGAWAVFLGITQIALAVEAGKTVRLWWLWLITGIPTTLFGLFLILLPGPGILSLLGLLSTFAILMGVLLIAAGMGLRSLAEEPPNSSPPTAMTA